MLVIIALLMLPGVFGSDFLYNYEHLDINLQISSDITVQPKHAAPEYVKAELHVLPATNEYQKLLNQQAVPALRDGAFQWDRPLGIVHFLVESKVRTNTFAPQVGVIHFPAQAPKEYLPYIRPTKNVDSDNDAVRAKASELAEGEDDLFVVLFKLGSWVEQNVQYNLSTLTADATQKASWVLENKVGVCDEITALFMAMARSLGVPARFVSGMSYTNSPYFNQQWQPHGWAEVYMPDVGWVPFDITFGEFGYVDATHIKLQDSLDPQESSITYGWVGDADVSVNNLDFVTRVEDRGNILAAPIAMSSEPVRDHVGFGSYNVVRTEVENKKETYAVTSLQASAPKEVRIEPAKQIVLLRPKQKKTAYWLVKVADNLAEHYTYTIPIVVTNERNFSSIAQFESEERAVVFDRDEARAFMVSETEGKKSNLEARVACTMQNVTLINTSIMITCALRNTGNQIIRGKLCVVRDCSTVTVQLNQELTINKSIAAFALGKFEARIDLNGNGFQKSVYLPYEVLDAPAITIENVFVPKEVEFDDEFLLTFRIERMSFAIPRDVTIRLDGALNEFRLNELQDPEQLTFTFRAKYLTEGENDIEITSTWKDYLSNDFEKRSMVKVTLGKLTAWQKVKGWFYRMGLV